jgi:hypothetical protein
MEVQMQDLTQSEIDEVNGAGWTEALGAGAALAAVGTGAFGASWGGAAVGVAFAVSPIAVTAMAALALYAGYQAFTKAK